MSMQKSDIRASVHLREGIESFLRYSKGRVWAEASARERLHALAAVVRRPAVGDHVNPSFSGPTRSFRGQSVSGGGNGARKSREGRTMRRDGRRDQRDARRERSAVVVTP